MKNKQRESEDIYWDPEEKCWAVSREYELMTRKAMMQKAIKRYEREIAAIDRELAEIERKKSDG